MPKENLGTDINGRVDYSLDAPVAGTATTLAANVAQSVTTPAGYNRIFLSYGAGTNVFVRIGGTATVPGSSFASNFSELNPAVRKISVAGGQTISFISNTSAFVYIRYDLGA